MRVRVKGKGIGAGRINYSLFRLCRHCQIKVPSNAFRCPSCHQMTHAKKSKKHLIYDEGMQ